MNALFGVPMDTIMVVLLVALGLCLLTGLWVLLRHRVVFRLGVRNIPRRPAQTVLIVIGLMLSTTIIAAALTTGDILVNTIRGEVYDISGYVDEIVVPAGGETVDQAGPVAGVTFPESIADDLRLAVGDDPNIDGIMAVLGEPVPGLNPRTNLSEPLLLLTGLDAGFVGQFGGLSSPDGRAIDLAGLGDREIVLGETPAENLGAAPGDVITVFIQNQPFELTVAAIAADSLLTGMTDPGMPGGFAMRLDAAQEITGKPGEITYIAITNAGDIDTGVRLTDTVAATVNAELEGTPYRVVPIKQRAIDVADEVANVFTSVFLIFGMFSIAAGVLLIFLIFVLLAAERQSELGISRAIGMKRRQLTQMFMAEGLAYDLVAALVGAALGVGVAMVMANVMTQLIGGEGLELRLTATWRSLLVAYSLGVVVTFMTITVSAWRVSRLTIVSAIRNLPEPASERGGRRGMVLGAAGVALGVLMILGGLSAGNIFLFSFGVSIVPFALVLILRRTGLSSRLLYSLASVLVLIYWMLPESVTNRVFANFGTGGMEMFFLSGIMLVGSATMLIMWNADVITWVVAAAGRRFSRWAPAVKTAVSYPMANRVRTGMTIAMFSLIIFSLVMMASINANFSTIFDSEYADAGWDIEILQPPTNPIGDLEGALAAQGYDTSTIVATASAREVGPFRTQLRLVGEETWRSHQLVGVDEDFFIHSEAPIAIIADGYASSDEVWEAVRTNPNLAVADGFTVPSQVVISVGADFQLTGVKPGDSTMTPAEIEIQNPVTGQTETRTIIGVIDSRVSRFFGIYMSQEALGTIFEQPTLVRYFVRLAPEVDSRQAAHDIEAALMPFGAQADATAAILERQNSQTRGFLYLFEGFMALGLVVGIAALGVISFRAVVERRQQIGMLRAIGYRRAMVAASFVLESTIVTALGVLSGLALGLFLSWQLMSSEEFAGTVSGGSFIWPWGQVLVFAGIAMVASLVMAYIPARQAARVPIAESLRYE